MANSGNNNGKLYTLARHSGLRSAPDAACFRKKPCGAKAHLQARGRVIPTVSEIKGDCVRGLEARVGIGLRP
jgi:hypothetical protein